MSIYGATKVALRGALRSWILDAKGTGVGINILSPGPVDTPSLRSAYGKAAGEEKVEEIVASVAQRSPLDNTGSPREIESVAAFLASDAASCVTGVELFVDGGMTYPRACLPTKQRHVLRLRGLDAGAGWRDSGRGRHG